MAVFKGYDPDKDERLYKVFAYDKETGEVIDSDILAEREIEGFLKTILKGHPNAEWGVDEY